MRARSWLWMVAVAVVATIALGLFAWRMARTFRPGATLVLAIDSAHPFDAGVTPAVARQRTLEILRNRVRKVAAGALVTADGDRVRVQLPSDAAPQAVARLLTRTGRLEFEVVDDGSEYMKQLAGTVVALHPDGVSIGRDGWSALDGTEHRDVFLRADDGALLETAIAAVTEKLPLPPERALVLERRPGGNDGGWRTYLVVAHADLTGDSIEDAEVSWDQNTGRPEVSLTLDSDGARQFATLTEHIVGRKLAILLEGHVNAAPVVESKIAGGHVRITMGGYQDPFQLQQDAKDLVAVLRTGAVYAPVTLVELLPPPPR
jgi:preprotein translocase subunit SecD